MPSFVSSSLPQNIAVLDLSGLNISGGFPDWDALGLPNLTQL